MRDAINVLRNILLCTMMCMHMMVSLCMHMIVSLFMHMLVSLFVHMLASYKQNIPR